MKLPSLHFKGKSGDIYNANAYALKCMYISFAVLFLAWILDIVGVFIVDIKIMTLATVGAGAICILSFIYAMIAGIDTKSSGYVVMLLFVGMATVACTMLAYHTTLFMLFPIVCATMYFDKKIMVFTGITLCVGCAVSVILGYYVGLCDANMLLLTYTDSASHTASLLSGDFTINHNLFQICLFFILPKWLIICAIMPTLAHVTKDIKDRTEMETLARHLAEIDGLTGIYNRNKFQREAGKIKESNEKFSVIFLDVNNLKKANDNLGHEYGDILICAVADILKSLKTHIFRPFRTGGDEFVVLLKGEMADKTEEMIETIKKAAAEKQLPQGLTLSVAIGSSSGNGEYFDTIVKEADGRMYKNKAEMKKAQQ